MHPYARHAKYSLLIFLTFSGGQLWSQRKVLDPKSDTTFWYKEKQVDARMTGLRDLTIATDSLHFRYWMENQAVDIWTNNYKTFYGIISNHTTSEPSGGFGDSADQPGHYYSNITRLTTSQAMEVYQLFDQAHLFNLPSDKGIKGWLEGDDGEEFIFELSTIQSYSFKTYWTPLAQEHVPEAAVLAKLNRQLRSLLNLEANWSTFISSLPKGCYHFGEMERICTNIEIPPK